MAMLAIVSTSMCGETRITWADQHCGAKGLARHEFIDGLGYSGWIGCEYKPAGPTRDGLGWLKPYLARGGISAEFVRHLLAPG